MSSTWAQNNEKPSSIKHEHTNDDEHSNLSNGSSTTSSSTTPIKQSSTNNQQTTMIDSMYSESATLKNLNITSGNNLQQEHGKIKLIHFINNFLN